ncbi:MAG: sugar phosphate isomerase/epimerase [bacterium]|nr:sugar phosphate isomerase/epimerase [bacterium]
MPKERVALALYTVRDELAKDYIGTLKKVAEIGYPAVQISGSWSGNLSAQELKSVLADFGLTPAGAHVPLDKLENELESVLEFHNLIGNNYLVCPWIPVERRQTVDDWKKIGEIFNQIGSRCKAHGFEFAYHNHSFEFVKFSGKYAYDILFETCAPDLVKTEIDVYWVHHGGENPAEYIRKYADRSPLVHLKDMANDEKQSFAEVGYGILDWDDIFAACQEAKMQWYIVEQDVCQRSVFESIKMSLEFLKSKGIV